MWCQMQFLCAIWCLLISIWENQFKINNLSRSIRFYKAFLHFSPHNNNYWFWNVKKGTSLKFGIEGWCMLHMNNFTLLRVRAWLACANTCYTGTAFTGLVLSIDQCLFCFVTYGSSHPSFSFLILWNLVNRPTKFFFLKIEIESVTGI